MLAQARARNVYEALELGEIHASLRDMESARFDAVFAADVFIYIGALEDVFLQIAQDRAPRRLVRVLDGGMRRA